MANEKVYVGEIGIKEFYRKIKQLINNFGGYEKATGTGDDNHPNVANPSTKLIYLVPVQNGSTPNLYNEWFWCVDETLQAGGSWELFGQTTYQENSWKSWSEQNGSSSADPTHTSVYIGANNEITSTANGNAFVAGSNNKSTANTTTIVGYNNKISGGSSDYQSFAFGNGNTLSGGSELSAIGRGNTVQHDATKSGYHSSMTVFGRSNTLTNIYLSDVFGSSNAVEDLRQSTIAGLGNTVTNADQGVILGSYNTSDGDGSSDRNRLFTLVGYSNEMQYVDQSVLIGQASKLTGHKNSVSGSVGNAYRSILCGFSSTLQGSENAAFGNGVTLSGYGNVLVGLRSSIGSYQDDYSLHCDENVVIGISARVAPKDNSSNNANILLGRYVSVYGSTNTLIGSTTINGSNNICMTSGGSLIGDFNTMVGHNTSEYNIDRAIVFGNWNNPNSNSVTLGECSYIGTNSMSLGWRNDSKDGTSPNAVTIGYDNTISNSVESFGGVIPSMTVTKTYAASPDDTSSITIPTGVTNTSLALDGTIPAIQPHEYAQFTGPTTEGEFYIFKDLDSSYYCYARGAADAVRLDYRIRYKANPTSTYDSTATAGTQVNGNWEMYVSSVQCPETFVLQKKVDGQYKDLPTSKLLGIIDVSQMELFDYSVIRLNGTDDSYLISIRLPSHRQYNCTINYADGTSEPVSTGLLSSPPRFNYKPVKSSGVAVTSITITEFGITGFIPQPTPPNYEQLYYAINMYYKNGSSITYKSDFPVKFSYTQPSSYISNIQTQNTAIGVHNTITGYNDIALGTYNCIEAPKYGPTFGTTIGAFNKIAYDGEQGYSNSDVALIGQNNTATNAANAYQFGRNNIIQGSDLPDTPDTASEEGHYTLAVNIGRNNTIAGTFNSSKNQWVGGEGVNIGKLHTAKYFGINIGQRNSANGGSISIGDHVASSSGAIALGRYTNASGSSLAFGYARAASKIKDTESYITAESSSIAIGLNRINTNGLSAVFGIGYDKDATQTSSVSSGSIAVLNDTCSSGGYAQKASNVNTASIAMGGGLTVTGGSIAIGYNNTSDGKSCALGNNITVAGGSVATGDGLDVGGSSVAYGKGLYNINANGVTLGLFNTQVMFKSSAVGISNYIIQNASSVVGADNTRVLNASAVLGNGNSANHYTVVVGHYNEAYLGNDTHGIVMGWDNIVANSNTSFIANLRERDVEIALGNKSEPWQPIKIPAYATNIRIESPTVTFTKATNSGEYWSSTGNIYYIDPSEHSEKDYASFSAFKFKYVFYKTTETAQVAYLRYTEVVESDTNAELTSNIVLGAYNTSAGHNCISIGANNFVGTYDPSINNDGFATAIGFDCTAVRNYDIAIGYQSIANGGENLAIHHSSATGYRNVAIGDSTVVGIANYAMMESNFSTNLITNEGRNAHNMFIRSQILHTGDNTTPNQFANIFTENFALHSASQLTVPQNKAQGGFSKNIFINDGMSNPNTPTIISAPCAQKNIIMYSKDVNASSNTNFPRVAGNSISVNGFFNRNISLHSAESVTGVQCIEDNTFIQSMIDVDESNSGKNLGIVKNLVTYGTIAGSNVGSSGATYYMANNIIGNESILDVSNDSTTNGSAFNILLSGSCLVTENPNPYWGGVYASVGNTLIGTHGYGLTGCFSHAESVSATKNGHLIAEDYEPTIRAILADMSQSKHYVVDEARTAYMKNSIVTVNFGDSSTIKSMYSFIFGQTNYSLGIARSRIHGDLNYLNNIASEVNNYGEYEDSMHYMDVFGSQNYLLQSSNTLGSQFAYNTVHGDMNYIYGQQIAHCTLWGDRNTITAGNTPLDTTTTDNWTKNRPTTSDTASKVYRVFTVGSYNHISSRIAGASIFGSENCVYNALEQNDTDFCISNLFIQGNNNKAYSGSNIITMGNGNVSTGHNSVAIGCQLKSNQWQTVLGKYNAEIAGPNRLASETPQDPTKAILIVGNGYSTKDDSNWQDEQYITRSNALELYANGDLKVTGDVTANNIPAAPTTNGEYLLKCTVSNGTKTYAWVAMNSTTV